MRKIEAELAISRKLLHLGRELISTVALDPLLHKIVNAAAELTGCESAALLLSSDEEKDLRFITAINIPDQLAEIRVPIDASIAGVAFRTGQPVVVPDTSVDPRYFRGVEEETGFKAHSLLAVPLQFKDRLIGVLEAENKTDEGGFTDLDVETLTTLATYATVAIENARMVNTLWTTREALEQRILEHERLLIAEREHRCLAEALGEASAALNSTLDYEEVLDRILAQLGTVVAYDAANVMLLDGEIAHLYRGRGYEKFGDDSTLEEIKFNLSDAPILAEIYRSRQPVILSDVRQVPQWAYAKPEHRWIRSYIGVPLHTGNEVIGFLNINSATPHFFTQADVAWLQTFADHVTIAIKNAHLYRQAQQELERRRKAEQSLQRHRDQLEEAVSSRTAALQQANQKLQQEIEERIQIEETLRRYAKQLEDSNEELDAFAHTVAHDLKGSLGIIAAYAELALSDDLNKEDLARVLSAISRNSHKMDRVIDDLLLLADVRRSGEVVIESLNMAEIVAEAIDRLEYPIAEYKAAVTVPETWPTAKGYAPWVEEIWVNYIDNALKYGGQPPQIELGATVRSDDTVEFWVRDNGTGLRYEEQARLFSPFTRLAPKRAKGHGLGLSIVKRIAERLGGRAFVKSQFGHGSTFSFTLPAEN